MELHTEKLNPLALQGRLIADIDQKSHLFVMRKQNELFEHQICSWAPGEKLEPFGG